MMSILEPVTSSTLPLVLPGISILASGDPIEYVRDLREQEGGPISVLGGIETIRALFLAGLIDTLTLTTHPVVTGAGRRLFDENAPTTRLRLLEVNHTRAGNAILTYGLRDRE